ncbi:PEP-CTERM sorting domain-containing protein [Kordiimonas laminariae]|uniref:PEP-CTERM sorting domain-containing protein n=1 Tax=Kordiimonas laminariae TaxID=2917717 RepID=UPI001FF3F894|nr:PEP-CTERM sorting domain-containing protein [Kordiimonas laminariae]MCK0070662.1 VPLPA-CTERM sorting domain-containing protein [Kordiimonas laminariae]
MKRLKSFIVSAAIVCSSLFSTSAQATFNIDVFHVANRQFSTSSIFSDPRLTSLLSGTPDFSFENEVISYNDAVLNSGALRPLFGPPVVLPSNTSNAFVSRTSGYFNVAETGTYSLLFRSDDSTRFNINSGQRTLTQINFGITFHTVELAAGLNHFTLEHFDQGGPGLLEIAIAEGNTRNVSNFSALRSAAPVPEPTSAFLLLSGLGGMAYLRRRKTATV